MLRYHCLIVETIKFNIHVRIGASALISISVDDKIFTFDLAPTINWVASSSAENSHKVPVPISFSKNTRKVLKLKINVENSDALVCGYEMLGANFVISSQPQWNVLDWQPYDISGHQGDNAEYHGNGSLQILAGQTVEFEATVFK